MSTSIANNNFSFALPSLTYIDTSLEEPKTSIDTGAAVKGGLVEWLADRVAAFRHWHELRNATIELSLLTDRELADIGLNRGDFVRMFDNAANVDLRSRGSHA